MTIRCPHPLQTPPQPALYARVSTDRQADQHTIDSQLAALHAAIAQDGLSLEPDRCFIDDGYSGESLLRPALERLRDAAAAGAFNRLYVLCPDRLARKLAHQAVLVEELGRCGVELRLLNRPLSDSPEDRLLLEVQGVIAEYERAKILERCRRGRLHAARAGQLSALGCAPYGFGYVPKGQGGGLAQWTLQTHEIPVVQRIFHDLVHQHRSLRQIAAALTAEGVPSPGGKSHWSASTVRGILVNPAYMGQACFGKVKIGPPRPKLRTHRNAPEHPRRPRSTCLTEPSQRISIPVPALVSPELFEAAQQQLAENRLRLRQRQERGVYLLSGLLVCRSCGYALCGKRKRSGGYVHGIYRCTGSDRYRFGGQRLCRTGSVHAEALERAVWEDVRQLLLEPQRLQREYERRLEEGPSQAQALRVLEEALGRCRRGITRLVEAYSEGMLAKEEVQGQLQVLHQRQQALNEQRERVVQQQQSQREMRLVIGQLEQFAAQAREKLEGADAALRRELIRTLVKQVEVDGQEVRIVYRLSPLPFAEPAGTGGVPHCAERSLDGKRTGFSIASRTPTPPPIARLAQITAPRRPFSPNHQTNPPPLLPTHRRCPARWTSLSSQNEATGPPSTPAPSSSKSVLICG